MALDIRVEKQGLELTLTMSGSIDEHAKLALDQAMVSIMGLKAGKAIFDLEQLEYINSTGARNWILWVNKIPQTIQFEFRNAAAVFLYQLMLSGQFRGRGMIKSIYVPLICDHCGQQSSCLIEMDKFDPAGDPAHSSEYTDHCRCGRQMIWEEPDLDLMMLTGRKG